MSPANASVIAARDKAPVLSGLDRSLDKNLEHLPVFDLCPRRYATSYEYRASRIARRRCPPRDPRFRECYEPAGDFPAVALGSRVC